VLVGLAGTALPALGWPPGTAPWQELMHAPSLGRSVALTLGSGIGATLLALAGAIAIAATTQARRAARRQRLLLPFLLAVPHLASAIGTAFLIAPSGWLARLVSPWLTGWERPPDLLTVNDPWGLALTFGLSVRECPFLLLAILAAQSQLNVGRSVAIARMAGYGSGEAWLKLILPVLYRQIRLPLYAVLAFALSVVDMALILGPTTPPVLAVRLLHWLGDPDRRAVGAAGANLQLGLIALAIAGWRLGEVFVWRVARPWLVAGPSRALERLLSIAGRVGSVAVFGLGLAGLGVIAMWSLADTWRFPAAWPRDLSLASWAWAVHGLGSAAASTLAVGGVSALIALIAVIACLEHETRTGARREARVMALAYLPLLVPQIGFLFGLQVLFARLGLDATLTGLVWSHLVFVLPYVVLMLREPYLALDPRYLAASRTLGSTPARTFWRVRLPLLRRPILVSLAVGFSVSVAQYLFPTLTTEALALALGGDRRLAAVAALLLAALPLLALGTALAVRSPRLGRQQWHDD
jgi:putative thiamine transport system permease protein